jgi:hypothetical protein
LRPDNKSFHFDGAKIVKNRAQKELSEIKISAAKGSKIGV